MRFHYKNWNWFYLSKKKILTCDFIYEYPKKSYTTKKKYSDLEYRAKQEFSYSEKGGTGVLKHLKKCNGFDKRYFLYFEDFALSVEMAKLGLIYYLPSMKIIHYGGNASRKGFRHILMFISSAVKFYNCYGWKFY